MKKILEDIKEFFSVDLFTLKGTAVSLWTVMSALFFIILLFVAASVFTQVLKNKILKRKGMEIGIREAIGNLFKYLFIFLGVIIIFSSIGIDLSAFTVLLGTLGVGIGFGLQNITSNFVSGISLLVERPVKTGDRIEVGDTAGDVVRIGLRATTVLTNDNIAIIVPNSNFITKEVINWSYNDKRVRLKIPVSVSYLSDVRQVEKLLVQVALENDDVLKTPPPVVRFAALGDSAIEFELRIWTISHIRQPGKIMSDLYFGIFEKLKENNVEIPFPQRVVHINRTRGTD